MHKEEGIPAVWAKVHLDMHELSVTLKKLQLYIPLGAVAPPSQLQPHESYAGCCSSCESRYGDRTNGGRPSRPGAPQSDSGVDSPTRPGRRLSRLKVRADLLTTSCGSQSMVTCHSFASSLGSSFMFERTVGSTVEDRMTAGRVRTAKVAIWHSRSPERSTCCGEDRMPSC